MAQTTLTQRVAALEKQLAKLLAKSPDKNWRKSVGMFGTDKTMKQIDEEGQRIRDKSRRQRRL